MKIISLTLTSIGILLAHPQTSTGQQVLVSKLAGSYSSATGSECSVLLKLCPLGKAEIMKTCRSEDGSRIDELETTPATWSFDRSRVTVQYGCVKDLLDYALHNSYQELALGHSGLALQQVEPVHWRSRLAGFGFLWREPPTNHWRMDPGGDFALRTSASGR
jgi:hypothetical protein